MQFPGKKIQIIFALLICSTLILSACSSKNDLSSSPPSSMGISVAEAATPNAVPNDENPNSSDPDNESIISDLISKSQRIKEISYTLIITEAGLSSESKIWFKDRKMKADSLYNGQRTIFIFDLINGEVVSYLPGDDMATKQKLREHEGRDYITPMDYILSLNTYNYQIIGRENLNGLECVVISFNDEQGEFKEWISTDYGLVVKYQENLNGEFATYEYSDIKIGAGSVPEGAFDLPEGIQTIDLNDIMSNVQNCVIE